MQHLQLTGGTTKKRRELDFYPTPPECTHALMKFLRLPPSVIWDPACGDGAMTRVFDEYGHISVGTDIQGGNDYLKEGRPILLDAIITNPPFSLSEKFIRKACDEAPLVAMLLKSQYWHAKSRYSLYYSNVPTYILPLTWRPNFTGREKAAPTMEVAWTVWFKGNHDGKYRPLLKP